MERGNIPNTRGHNWESPYEANSLIWQSEGPGARLLVLENNSGSGIQKP